MEFAGIGRKPSKSSKLGESKQSVTAKHAYERGNKWFMKGAKRDETAICPLEATHSPTSIDPNTHTHTHTHTQHLSTRREEPV